MNASNQTNPERESERERALAVAVELGVDRDDACLAAHEEPLWEELEAEFQALLAKIGPVWIAA